MGHVKMKPDSKLFISNTCEAMPSKVWGKMISSQTSMASPFLHQNKDNYRLVWIWKNLSHSFLQRCKRKRFKQKVSPNQKNNERRIHLHFLVCTYKYSTMGSWSRKWINEGNRVQIFLYTSMKNFIY